ncbi:unnamed protein product [Linum tenue]|uniref:CCHC-type domain-containing protein n=1 Tax=Linum tenue TaxID=586396 RepID=A0AAV0L510_9ROSI|nr:unnamed protein product [Linum tenue]
MIVWVHLPALKIHFYHKEVLTQLGNLIGRTIKLDYHTLNQQRAKFARIAVEVDLDKPLVPRIFLDDGWQKVEYENLPIVCFECGKIDHTNSTCPLLRQPELDLAVITGGETLPEISLVESPEPQAGFGPWMLVTKKHRRTSRDPNTSTVVLVGDQSAQLNFLPTKLECKQLKTKNKTDQRCNFTLGKRLDWFKSKLGHD